MFFRLIMTGIYALVGGVLTAAGVGGDVAVNYLAFVFVGPHIAFAGGVAAAGYAGRRASWPPAPTSCPLNGRVSPTCSWWAASSGAGPPDPLLHRRLAPVIGSAGPATTDLPGITCLHSGVVTVWPSARPA